MRIVVIGGTGLVGSKLVQKLKQLGHEAVAAAPNTGVDTITGRGLAKALAKAEVAVDVSNSQSMDDQAAMDFFQTSGRSIIAAEKLAGVRHHVVLSVVGTGRLQASGYFRAKLAQERLVEQSGIPYTLIHATQFFEFIRSIADVSTRGSEVHIPPVEFQPMAADDVATAMANSAVGEPVNGLIEIGGPQIFQFDEAVRKVLDFDQDPRKVIADAAAPYYGVEVGETTLVPGPAARLGETTLDWWLVHVPPPSKPTNRMQVAEPAH
jgi:uncharacterized protein YbjT (DUF2867 family)